jgi:hypothetical protein
MGKSYDIGESLLASGCDDKMNMVRHQAIAVDFEFADVG